MVDLLLWLICVSVNLNFNLSLHTFQSAGTGMPRVTAKDMLTYIALFFEAVRKSTDLADGLTRVFEESKGVLLSGRGANSP